MRLMFIFLLLISSVSQARMYQWTDPDTGTTQLSGKPPSWYRSAEPGPRVIVFDKARIIDDTRIEISEIERDELRQQALVKVEEDMALARQKALEAEQLKAALSKEQDIEADVPAGTETESAPPAAENESAGSEVAPVVDDDTMDEMRALVELWEQQKTREAKQKVEEGEMSSVVEPVTGTDQ